MFAPHARNHVIRENRPATEALWKFLNHLEDQLCVVDDDDKFTGMIARADFPAFAKNADQLLVGDLCNRKAAHVAAGPHAWHQARSVFLGNRAIRLLAEVDEDRNILDLHFRFQAFYDRYFNSQYAAISALTGSEPVPGEMIHLNYAYCLWLAAQEARNLGYPKISAIEFGVAQGRGLTDLEWHSRAIEKMFGVGIEVYGFDTGEGLPELADDYREPPYLWRAGAHTMLDQDGLRERLTKASLVMGDIRETGPTFFSAFNPAPVGVMLVDVDLYSSTVSILNMFQSMESNFLPRVFMYFDDIPWNGSCVGEALAIKEFNTANLNKKISPEDFYGASLCGNMFTSPVSVRKGLWMDSIKTCHLFDHPRYKNGSNI